MTKIHFQNLRSKNFGFFSDKKSKIWNFNFLNWLFEEKFFEKKIGRKIVFDRFFFSEIFSSKSQFKKWKFQIFDFLSENFSFFFRSQILKMDFRHENLIFFIQIFFPGKVWSYYIGKQHRRWAYLTNSHIGTDKLPRTLEIRQVVILFRERLHVSDLKRRVSGWRPTPDHVTSLKTFKRFSTRRDLEGICFC